MEKDLQGIQKFFSRVDKDKSGQISKQEFLSQFERASQIAQSKKVQDAERKLAGEDEFAAFAPVKGDESMAPGNFGGQK